MVYPVTGVKYKSQYFPGSSFFRQWLCLLTSDESYLLASTATATRAPGAVRGAAALSSQSAGYLATKRIMLLESKNLIGLDYLRNWLTRRDKDWAGIVGWWRRVERTCPVESHHCDVVCSQTRVVSGEEDNHKGKKACHSPTHDPVSI